MTTKRILISSITLILATLLLLSGCILYCRSGHVSPLGMLDAKFNMCLREVTPQEDGTYLVSFEDTATDAHAQTTLTVNWVHAAMIMLVDPAILQIPADVTDIAAAFDNNQGLTGELIVTAGLQSVAVTPTTTIRAEAGQQLVIIDLPEVEGLVAVAGADNLVTMAMTGTVNPPRAIDVKVINAAKAEANGRTYYLPLFPAVTDFSRVPSFTIPLSDTPQNIELPIAADFPQTPDRLVYDLSPEQEGDDDEDDSDADSESEDADGSSGGGGGSCFIRSSSIGR